MSEGKGTKPWLVVITALAIAVIVILVVAVPSNAEGQEDTPQRPSDEDCHFLSDEHCSRVLAFVDAWDRDFSSGDVTIATWRYHARLRNNEVEEDFGNIYQEWEGAPDVTWIPTFDESGQVIDAELLGIVLLSRSDYYSPEEASRWKNLYRDWFTSPKVIKGTATESETHIIELVWKKTIRSTRVFHVSYRT